MTSPSNGNDRIVERQDALPTSLPALTQVLEAGLAELEQLARAAELRIKHAQALERAAVVARFLEAFTQKRARLRELGADEGPATRWVTLLERESAQVAQEIESTSNASERTVVDASRSAALPSAPTTPPAPAQTPQIATPDLVAEVTSSTRESELRERLVVLSDAVDVLEEATEQHVDAAWLAAEIDAIAAELRIRQGELSDIPHDLDRSLTRFFGRLTRICNEDLVPRQVRVKSLRRDFDADWPQYLAEATTTRDRERTRRAADEKQRVERQAEAARTERAARLGKLYYDGTVEALRAHLETADPEDRFFVPEGQELLAEIQRHLQFADVRLEALLRPVARHDRHGLIAGRALRPLRRWMKKNLENGDQPALPPQEQHGDDSGSTERPRAAELDELRGTFAGRRGVLVGGLADEYRRSAILEHFGFALLEWVEHDQAERADAETLAQRILAGRFDVVVIFTRFIGHMLYGAVREAVRAAKVELVTVDRGLGVVAICRALAEARRVRLEREGKLLDAST